MSTYEASITNPKKQLEFYKDLSEQLQRENFKLQARADKYKCRNEKAIEYINSQNPDAGVSGKRIKEILKGNNNEL